jgi:alcohol dehydrogenase (NADP+)
MEKLVGRGTRFIGLANFSPKQVDDILKIATIKPKVLQIELHPYLPQTEFVKSVQAKGIAVTAYAPLANTNSAYRKYGSKIQQIFSHPTIQAVANARGCTPAQVVLGWNMKRNVVVIPKASKIEHQRENIQTLEKCKLTDDDAAKIDAISKAGQYRMNGDVCDGAGKGCWEGLVMGY